jgi:hypothetical protein
VPPLGATLGSSQIYKAIARMDKPNAHLKNKLLEILRTFSFILLGKCKVQVNVCYEQTQVWICDRRDLFEKLLWQYAF